MAFLGEKFNFRSGVRSALRRSYAAFGALFDFSDSRREVEKCLLGVVKYLLSVDGKVDDGKILRLRNLLADFYPDGAVELLAGLRELPIVEPTEAVAVFAPLSDDAKNMIIRFLLQTTLADDAAAAKFDSVAALAKSIGIDDKDFAELDEFVRNENRKRNQLLRSGAGILVALGVIVVFILMATWLRSVAFGLIGAYVLLPLEKFFERRLRAGKSFCYWFFRGLDFLIWPLRKLSSMVSRHDEQIDEIAVAAKKEKKIIAQAVGMTAVTFLLVVSLIAIFLFNTAGMYTEKLHGSTTAKVGNVQVEKKDFLVSPHVAEIPAEQSADIQQSWWRRGVDKVKGWFGSDKNVADGKSTPVLTREVAAISESQEAHLLTPVVNFLDRVSNRFQKLPWVQRWIEHIQNLLQDENFVNNMWTELLRKSGGILSFSLRVFGTITGWVVDLLLSIFFGLLFLTKLAEFCRSDNSRGRQSEYLVSTVFNGVWLPKADESTIADANRLISGTIARLRIWARGYLTIVLIDMAVYTTAFFLLRVPYFPILGIIAGCGVLLPYIGPIFTATLTVVVTMISGGGGAQMLCVIAFYLIYSGVIEQFITYPAIIGESLGLTTLETIIVVLLGALVAGISGMILALPTASVIKFLIPQIYRWIGGLGAAEKAKIK